MEADVSSINKCTVCGEDVAPPLIIHPSCEHWLKTGKFLGADEIDEQFIEEANSARPVAYKPRGNPFGLKWYVARISILILFLLFLALLFISVAYKGWAGILAALAALIVVLLALFIKLDTD